MVDNTTLNTGAGGDVIASDDIAGVKHQRVKIEFGADGSATEVSPASPLPVYRIPAAAAALSNVTGSAASVTLLASNSARRMATITNDSTATLYVKFGASASATSYTVALAPNDYYELPTPVYTGIIDGIWSAAAGAARVTELT